MGPCQSCAPSAGFMTPSLTRLRTRSRQERPTGFASARTHPPHFSRRFIARWRAITIGRNCGDRSWGRACGRTGHGTAARGTTRGCMADSAAPDSFPQLRKDPIVDRWVLIAPERAERPTELEEPAHLAHHETCPFCEGREAETTPEILAVRAPGSPPDSPGWKLRVVANRYPAVRPDARGPQV